MIHTLLFGPDEVFSSVINLPSVSTSLIAIGPVDVLWYVVLADTSPLIIFILICESSDGKIKVHFKEMFLFEPRREKTGFLHMRKQRRRSASR